MKYSPKATDPATLSTRAEVGILAITGSTVAVGVGLVVADGLAVVVVDVVNGSAGVVAAGPGSPPVHAASVASATEATAYASSGRCGRAAAVIGVPCRSSIIVRLHGLKGVSCPSFPVGNLRASSRTRIPSGAGHPQAPRAPNVEDRG
jgi:hypothetical protein